MTLPNPWRRTRILTAALALALAPLLGGCAGSLLPGGGEPPRLFALTPKSTFAPDLPAVRRQLIIELPQAAAGLNSTRIAILQSATSLNYYARASWTDLAPVMVQTLMVESFENTGRIVAVGRESIGLRADFNLKTDLREFQAQHQDGKPPLIHVRVNGKLVRMPERQIVAAQTFEEIAPAGGSGLEAAIASFDDALGKVLKRLVEWSLRTIAAQPE